MVDEGTFFEYKLCTIVLYDCGTQGLSTPDPSLSPTHLSIRRGRATTTHYTHHQISLMVSRNTTLVPSLGVTHWASLCGRPQRWHAKGACATPKDKDKDIKIKNMTIYDVWPDTPDSHEWYHLAFQMLHCSQFQSTSICHARDTVSSIWFCQHAYTHNHFDGYFTDSLRSVGGTKHAVSTGHISVSPQQLSQKIVSRGK